MTCLLTSTFSSGEKCGADEKFFLCISLSVFTTKAQCSSCAPSDSSSGKSRWQRQTTRARERRSGMRLVVGKLFAGAWHTHQEAKSPEVHVDMSSAGPRLFTSTELKRCSGLHWTSSMRRSILTRRYSAKIGFHTERQTRQNGIDLWSFNV